MVNITLVARPWEPKDLLDDLQVLIDEEPYTCLSERSILEMAKAYLQEYFDLHPPCPDDCVYKGKRHQKCSCCARNRYLKDCYIRR